MGRSEADRILEIRRKPLPQHVAIVPDGNGRWATQRGLPRPVGHRAGVEALKRIVKAALDLGIGCLTFYSFSTENWSRSQDEVNALMSLLLEYLDQGLKDIIGHGVKIQVIGRRDGLGPGILKAIRRAETETVGFSAMRLVLAFNYGGRAELVDAIRRIAGRIEERSLSPDQVDETVVERELYTAGLPDPDVIIRTSGEVRVSNFLLWQSAYAEFVSSPVLWPDFTPEEFFSCIEQYQRRTRRFGGAAF